MSLRLPINRAAAYTKKAVVTVLRSVLSVVSAFGIGRAVATGAARKQGSVVAHSLLLRVLLVAAGGFLLAIGATMTILASFGVSPTDVLLTGLSNTFGLSFTQIVWLFQFGMFLLVFIVGARPGIGAFLMALSITIGFTFSFHIVPTPSGVVAQVFYLVVGVLLVALGIEAAACCGLGKGTYELLTERISDISRGKISEPSARTFWELSMFSVGAAMGGQIGIGTIFLAISIGYLLKFLNLSVSDYVRGRRIRIGLTSSDAEGRLVIAKGYQLPESNFHP